MLSLLLALSSLIAQYKISGKIYDGETKQPIAFVHVIADDDKSGTVSDEDGNFSLETEQLKGTVSFQIIGYAIYTTSYRIKDGAAELGTVFLKKHVIPLDEITITSGMVREDVDAIAISTISARTIQNELGDRPLPFTFLNSPGVFTFRNGGGSGDAEISIRGFNHPHPTIPSCRGWCRRGRGWRSSAFCFLTFPNRRSWGTPGNNGTGLR